MTSAPPLQPIGRPPGTSPPLSPSNPPAWIGPPGPSGPQGPPGPRGPDGYPGGPIPDPFIATLVDDGGQVYNVKAFGAVGDGVADDTLAIQATIDAALSNPITNGYGSVPIHLPRGKYKITSTLNLSRSDNAFVFLNVFGAGHGSEIQWAGATNGIAIQATRLKQFRIASLMLSNTVAAGTTIGLLFTNSSGGTGTNNGVIESLLVSGFNNCVKLGDASTGAATSELTWINLVVQNCATGVLISSTGNTLNNQFHNLQMFSCSTFGLSASGADGVFVHGGASAGNATDFSFSHGGAYHVYGFRSESNTAQWLRGGSTSAVTTVNIFDCRLTGTSAADGVLITTGSGPTTIVGCIISGKVNLSSGGAFQSLEMISCGVMDTFAFRPDPNTAAINRRAKYRIAGCYQMDATSTLVGEFPDEEGFWSGTVLSRTPLRRLSALPTTAGQPVVGYTDERAVRGISGTTISANNLRGQAVFAGTGTVAVVFPVGVAEVQSVVCTGATSGVFILSFDGGDSSGITWNSTNANMTTRLGLNPMIGSGNVTCAGGPLPSTPITVTFAGNHAYGPQGLLTVAPISNTLVGGTAVVTRTTAGTGAAPEPDNAYFIALSGNVNETFWVTGKTTSGFTINSSNPASTATVDWHLIR